MTKDEMKNRISMALKDPILQQGFEIICKNLAELEKANEWHYVKDGDYPKDNKQVLCCLGNIDSESYEVGYYNDVGSGESWHFETYHLPDHSEKYWGVSAWKKITGPEVK